MAYNNRGGAYNELGLFQGAIQDLDEAIRLDPRYALAYINRAITHTLLRKDIEAQKDVEQAVELGFNRSELEAGLEELRKLR